YLLHHVRAAGGRAEQVLGAEALELLARHTRGVPRLLNQAGHHALALAAQAGAAQGDPGAAHGAPTRPGPPRAGGGGGGGGDGLLGGRGAEDAEENTPEPAGPPEGDGAYRLFPEAGQPA